MDIDWFGISQWIYHELHMMFGSVKTAIVTIMLGIDIFYRIEWFELHSPLHQLLAPLFGG